MNPILTDVAHADKCTTRLARFASAGALADWTADKPDYTDRGTWTGNESGAQARANVRSGRLEAVKAAQALLDQVDAQGIQTYRPRWQADVAGALPDVPRYLAGSPDCMLRPDRRQSESAPVKLFVSVCVSAGIEARTLSARGNALLALAIKLSQCRPVELWLFADMEGRQKDQKRGTRGHAIIPMIQVPTSPLDMAAASYAMTAPAFLRQLCFGYGTSEGFTGSWAWGAQPSHTAIPSAYERRINEALGVGEDDVVIYGGHINHKLIGQPVQWVTEQLKKYVSQD
jgi:hypothetical protein